MMHLSTSRVFAARSVVQRNSLRMFSGVTCESSERVREVLLDYQKVHYSRELASRFKKELFQPYIGTDGAVHIEQVNTLLRNIGHPQDVLSEKEQTELLTAAGSTTRSIPVTKMMELLD